MKGFIEKMLLAGLGGLTITREKAEEIVADLVKKGEVARNDQSEFVNRLLEKGENTRTEIEKLFEKSMAKVLDRLNIPTKSDIDVLVKKIDELARKK
ncbi:phasin family protein [candidate division WOR-3 bacterium]|nr:phasin family protein [candidate division WOR-3 bacterium]